MHLGLAFSVYGEGVIITVQNWIIILMIWGLNKQIGLAEKALWLVFFTVYVGFLYTDSVTEDVWSAINSSSMIFTLAARVP